MEAAEVLSTISLISYIVAGVALVAAIFVWFLFRIPTVVGDLSGRTAKRSIAKIRASNERAGAKGYQPSAANVARGKLTEAIPQEKAALKPDEQATEPLHQPVRTDGGPKTEMLRSNAADPYDTQGTQKLDEGTVSLLDEGATTALNVEAAAATKRTGGVQMTLLEEIILIHTDEVIA